jgi:TolB-like protein/Tfp pilus assembly protein PilF
LEENNSIVANDLVDEVEKSVQKKPSRKIIFYATGGFLALIVIYLAFNYLSFGNFSILSGNHLKPDDKSIAVLPFKNLSSDEENRYFAEGVTRNILDNLIQISEIKVINSPVEELGGKALNLNEMAGKLSVRFFLSGSVQKSGEQVMVIAELTDITKKNQIIWSEKYPRKLSDIFQIQSEIANEVATHLQTVIAKKEKEQIEKMPTQNMEAHAWYVMGRYLLDRRYFRELDILKYITPFKNAIAADPEYAEAYAGLADVYLTFTRTNSYPRPEGYIKAKENVLKALELNSNLAEAHTTLGVILYRAEWKWEDARKELVHAIELNPNYGQAHRYYAELMEILRQRELARFHGFKAAELDPVSPYLILWKADFLVAESKFNEAKKEFDKFIELYPENPSGYWYLYDFYIKTGEELKAIESLQKATEFYPEDKPYVDTIKVVYDKHGIKGLEKWLNEYNIKYEGKGSWKGIVLYYNKIGEKEKALEWLEKAYKWQDPYLSDMNTWLELDNLRNEPRFQALLEKMGLTKYQ